MTDTQTKNDLAVSLLSARHYVSIAKTTKGVAVRQASSDAANCMLDALDTVRGNPGVLGEAPLTYGLAVKELKQVISDVILYRFKMAEAHLDAFMDRFIPDGEIAPELM